MKLFGYTISKELLNQHPAFDSLAEPFEIRGNSTGFLVLHGIGGTPANIRPVAEALAGDGFSVIAPLLPGHGETIAKLQQSSWKEWLDAALAAYDRLVSMGCTKIIPVGLSLGAILSGLVAAERPCEGLILLSPPIRMRPYLRVAKDISFLFPYVNYDQANLARSQSTSPYWQMYEGFSTRKLIDLQILIRKLLPLLKKLTCPVFAVWAELDNKVDPSSSRILRSKLKNAPLAEFTVYGSPHGSTYGPNRERVASIVRSCAEEILSQEDPE